MMKRRNMMYFLLAGGVSLLLSGEAAAYTFVFDNYDTAAPDVVQNSITFNEGGLSLEVTAGVSNTNLWNTASLDGSDWNSANVYQDLSPIHAGLGVHGWGSGADNFEGSVGSGSNDEILFFDFGELVTLAQVNFNGLQDGNHSPTVNGDPLFSLFTSVDGTNYTALPSFINTSLTLGEYLNTGPGGLTSRYFAVGAVGPTGSASYIEALEVTGSEVPEPATMLLFGAGLAGIAGFKRRKNT